MLTLTYFRVHSEAGQRLLDDYVRPLCERLNVRLIEAREGANRGAALAARQVSSVVLWDCTVGDGHVYRALDEWVKTSDKDFIVSRSALPRNVLGKNQCAPKHGETLSNAAIGEWLEYQLRRLAQGARGPEAHKYRSAELAQHYWMTERPADVFLSFRGSHTAEADTWRKAHTAATGQAVRMVPAGEYAYAMECVTRQQMWEVVAKLLYEITATKHAVIFQSEDYVRSFWTGSELLAAFYLQGLGRRKPGQDFIAMQGVGRRLEALRPGMAGFAVPALAKAQSDRLFRILNNSDPYTAAPETRGPPSGLGKLAAWTLGPAFGYYAPEFTGDAFWRNVRIPCPHCAPSKRAPESLDWAAHLRFDTTSGPGATGVDYYGYFDVTPERLERGNVTCPRCNMPLTFIRHTEPRTVWAPIQTTEKDQNRPVIIENPVWEVEVKGQRGG